MTDFIRTIWQNTANTSTGVSKPISSTSPVDQIRLLSSTSSVCNTSTSSSTTTGIQTQCVIKLEPPVSPSYDLESHSGKAQRLARVNARRDKRKSSYETTSMDTFQYPKKLKTEGTTSADSSGGTSTGTSTGTSAATIAGEDRLRAMEAQLEHLDPDSKEAKKKRRLIRNRMSAQLHRERKKAYVGQLEDQLQAKENQLKRLQEQLAALAMESEQLKQQLKQKKHEEMTTTTTTATTTATTTMCMSMEQDMVIPIKMEPVLVEKKGIGLEEQHQLGQGLQQQQQQQATVDWTVCLDDVDEAMVGEDLLCDLDESPLAAYGLHSISEDPMTTALAEEEERQKLQAQTQSCHEIHAAKKNLAMMMAMMFSVTFCGQGESVANVTSGSNFSSMFNVVPVKELSQMSIASRIVACLEKTSWEDFQDVSSWTASAASAAAAAAVAVSADKKSRSSSTQKPADSPSASSDVTDAGSCASPKELKDDGMSFDTDLIEEFVYPVDEPFAPALADTNWFGADSADFGHSDVEGDDKPILETKTTFKPVSMTSRLYEKLTKLWNEKNQVILTVLNSKNEVIRRSVADMSTIRKGMSTGALFPTTAATASSSSSDKLLKQHDHSVTFLYPLSAFSEDQRSAAFPNGGTSDQVFLEVSCQINGVADSVLL